MTPRTVDLHSIPRLLPAAACALATCLPAQGPFDWKLRGNLARLLRDAKPRARLPVYFVMRDRLGYTHWFPRVNRLPLAERRRTVIAELRQHAARTQRRVLGALRDAARDGRAAGVRSNWLGNFVRARATATTVRDVLALDDVWEAWPIAGDPSRCPDAAACRPVAAGNGPIAVGADRVWTLGFRGQDVVVMNADAGINVQHTGLRNRLWINPGEIPGNGLDDDNNGFADDVYGWDFGTGTPNIDDGGGHGTETAGVLVADESCGSVTYGIAPEAHVMTGKLSLEVSQWDAIQYALQMGADVQTSSHSYKNYFFPPPNYAMHRDVGEATLAAGLIRTNSTSNEGRNCNTPTSVVQRPFNVALPGSLPPPYLDRNQTWVGRKGGVIGVGAYSLATGQLDPDSPCGPVGWHYNDLSFLLPSYPRSSWDPQDNDYPWFGGVFLGLLKPDVTAPTGTDTTSGPGATCQITPFSGTSNATPIVMGCIMLWKSANKSLTPEDAAMIVHQTSRDAGSVPGMENDWGAGKIDAYQGLLRALAVHRVNGEPAWRVTAHAGGPLSFAVDGSPQSPVLIALGTVRQDVDLGIVTSGIGSNLFQLYAGTTDPTGDAAIGLTVPPIAGPVTLYSQAFVDDRSGPTGLILPSNVIELQLVP